MATADQVRHVAAEPDKFHMPVKSDERYNWVRVWLAAIDEADMQELVLDACAWSCRGGSPSRSRP